MADKLTTSLRQNVIYYYDVVIPLDNDPEFRFAGVTMHARVEADKKGGSHNRIEFYRGEKFATIECVHTAIYAATVQKISELAEGEIKEIAATSRGSPAILPPLEHFVALKSFASGIAAVGLFWLIDPNKSEQDSVALPISERLIMQIHSALIDIVPEFLKSTEIMESLDFNALLAFGTRLLNAGFINQSIAYLERATLLNPENAKVLYSLGVAYHGTENYAKAIHALEQVVKIDPKNADAWIHLSAARSSNGDKAGSLEAMDRWQSLPIPRKSGMKRKIIFE